MKRSTTVDLAVFVLLVTLGVATRIEFRQLPNFKPVAALALFAGVYFSARSARSAHLPGASRQFRTLAAIAVPLTIMGVSDFILGGYDPRLMFLVYGMLALPVVVGSRLQRMLFPATPRPQRPQAAVLGLMACSLAFSVAFFAVTNFGCWILFDYYDRSWSGLWHCFAMALPFFRYTVAGDLSFAFLTFGVYAWVRYAVAQKSSDIQAQSLAES